MRRTVEMVIGAVALTALLTGCSSASTTTGASSTDAVASSAVPPTSADPNAGLKDGTQLKALLPSTKDLPAGFKVIPAVVRDSADVFGPPSTATAPMSSACKKLDTNAWIDGAGIGSAAFAQTGFNDSYGDEIDAEIDSFRGTLAQKVMTNLRKLFAACSRYKTTTSGTPTTVKVVAKAGPRVGDDSVRAVMTSPVWTGGTTLVAVRVGKAVVTILYSSSRSDLGAKAANLAATIAQRL